VLVGRRCEVLKKAAAQLGAAAIWESHDILQLEKASPLVSRLRDRVGTITGLVNNAGIHIKKSALELTPEEFLAMLQTHLVASFALTRAVLPEMIERRHGNILFISSMASLFGLPLVSAYSAAKAGHLGLVRSLATEVSPYGVRVNSIAPGWIESEMMRRALNGDAKRADKILGRTPMKRFGEPEDIGWAATYLCSQAAKFITGVVLPIDGGASIGF
jgi:gluconate 5-dehydrogenase